jgi:hypothetical protein
MACSNVMNFPAECVIYDRNKKVEKYIINFLWPQPNIQSIVKLIRYFVINTAIFRVKLSENRNIK